MSTFIVEQTILQPNLKGSTKQYKTFLLPKDRSVHLPVSRSLINMCNLKAASTKLAPRKQMILGAGGKQILHPVISEYAGRLKKSMSS